MSQTDSPYTGRFAPSPTGPLHIGSLIGALASFLDARANGGRWLLRMENIDPPREIAGADQRILSTLRRHGLLWDGDVLEQSSRHVAYNTALTELLNSGHAFYCSCSRRQLRERGGLHQGECAAAVDPGDCAIRLRVPDVTVTANDRLQPPLSQNLQTEVGDFTLKRRDGHYAYQLAVVVDDAFQNISHVVRGSDLWISTPRQQYLQSMLKFPAVSYLHFPVIVGDDGHKLSKQTFAAAVDDSRACENLLLALRFLNQPLPPPAQATSPTKILGWAVDHWQLAALPRVMGQPQSAFYNN
ncbi:MAG TPA: tRNA glutamyl-Q(34) synthetase GluQRS [Spongiibacteraceae bacterium]|nr:tRNA glutamyl-Q(34) synthetase GluQRS [Spongiibacteraceae bacterium]HCS26061.1 tRNA glutamyl-Q(34) synthetase GluQRS [Spongiibacteraceae bacterium]